MNNPLVKILLIGLLLMLVVAPFAGLAPLMLILLGFGVGWAIWLLVQAFFTANTETDNPQTELDSARNEP